MRAMEWPVVRSQGTARTEGDDVPAAGHRAAQPGEDRPAGSAARRDLTALVIGVGNELRGDDGIGPAVVRALRRTPAPDVELIETDGHDLTELLAEAGAARIVLVDAADFGRAAGTWMRTSPEALLDGAAPVSHTLGLAQALDLLAALGLRLGPIAIYVVQSAKVGWGPGLSRAARRGVSAVAAAIRQELCLPQPSRRGRTVLRTEQDVRSLPCRVGTA